MRRLRGRLRLSQPEVALRGNLSLQTGWAIENGQVSNPQEGTLAGLAEALETTVEVLLGEGSTTPVVDTGSAGGPSVHEHTAHARPQNPTNQDHQRWSRNSDNHQAQGPSSHTHTSDTSTPAEGQLFHRQDHQE